MNKKQLGLICIILAIISFFISLMLNWEKFNIPYLNGIYTPVAVNIELPSKFQKTIKINGVDFSEPTTQNNTVIISQILNGKVKNLTLSTNNINVFKEIISIDIFIGRKFYHFNSSDLNTQKEVTLPIEHKNDALNYRGNFNAIAVIFLALFYNIKYFIITWIGLIFGTILLIDKININKNLMILGIFLIALLLRFNQFTAYPLWWDEVFVINLPSSQIYPLNSIFLDPGNPSFFFLLIKIYTIWAPTTIEFMRLIPVILGTGSVIGIYFLTKKFSNSNSALLASFIASVSIYHICYSQELRGYSLTLLLVPFVIITLFDYLKQFNFKNGFKFFLISSMLINTHIFGLFFLFTNYIYGIENFIKNKDKFRKYFNFTLCHIFIFLTFAPYLLLNFIQTLTGREGFNSHLEKACFDIIYKILGANFGSMFILFLFVTLCIIFIRKNNNNKTYIKYGIFTLILFYTTSIIVSCFRPLLHEYYFIELYPLFISLFAVLIANLYSKFSNLWIKVGLIVLTILMIGSQTYNNSWKMKNQKESIVALVNARAEDNSREKLFIYIQPKRIKDYYNYKNNILAGTSPTKFCKIYYVSKDELTQYSLYELRTINFQCIKTSFGDISDIIQIKF